jgi:hypothetical protein
MSRALLNRIAVCKRNAAFPFRTFVNAARPAAPL